MSDTTAHTASPRRSPASPANGAGSSPSACCRSSPGFFALTDVVAFTLVSVIFIGAMLLVSGVFQIIHAFATKTWGQFGLSVAMGLLYIAGGLLIMQEPVQGSFVITLLLLVALVVSGIVPHRHRAAPPGDEILVADGAGRAVQRRHRRMAVRGAAVVRACGCWAR